MDASKLTESYLSQFTGSENWYRSGINPSVTYTDGAKHVAEHGEAYWLLDEIALRQLTAGWLRHFPFQVWRLDVKEDSKGTITISDGNGKVLWIKDIPFTDFPVESVTLWYQNGVIFLPSEY